MERGHRGSEGARVLYPPKKKIILLQNKKMHYDEQVKQRSAFFPNIKLDIHIHAFILLRDYVRASRRLHKWARLSRDARAHEPYLHVDRNQLEMRPKGEDDSKSILLMCLNEQGEKDIIRFASLSKQTSAREDVVNKLKTKISSTPVEESSKSNERTLPQQDSASTSSIRPSSVLGNIINATLSSKRAVPEGKAFMLKEKVYFPQSVEANIFITVPAGFLFPIGTVFLDPKHTEFVGQVLTKKADIPLGTVLPPKTEFLAGTLWHAGWEIPKEIEDKGEYIDVDDDFNIFLEPSAPDNENSEML